MESGNNRLTAQVCCREHPDEPLIEDFHAGDMICPLCGLVVGDRVIDVSSEWITLKADVTTKDKSRVGKTENPLLDGSDLSTMIVSGNDTFRDESGKYNYRNRRGMNNSDKILYSAFRDTEQMADRLNLPKVIVDQANILFKKIHKNLKSSNSDAVVSACLYIACRQDGVPRTFKEICAVSKVSKKKIGKVFTKISQMMENKGSLVQTDDFISRFCSKLCLSKKVQKVAMHIAKTAVEMGIISGRSQVTIVAAAIYMASNAVGDKITAKEISEVAGVGPAAISVSYSLLFPKAACLFPAENPYINKTSGQPMTPNIASSH